MVLLGRLIGSYSTCSSVFGKCRAQSQFIVLLIWWGSTNYRSSILVRCCRTNPCLTSVYIRSSSSSFPSDLQSFIGGSYYLGPHFDGLISLSMESSREIRQRECPSLVFSATSFTILAKFDTTSPSEFSSLSRVSSHEAV